MRSIAAVNEVGVAIDQGGRNPAAFAIDDASAVTQCGRKLILGAGENNSPFARGDGSSLDDSESQLRWREGRKTGVEPDRVEVIGVACLNHSARRLRPNCSKGKRPGLAS
jgi:hypothetical protein